MRINKPIKLLWVLGILMLFSACTNKMAAEKSIKPKISIPSYHKDEPFVCQNASTGLWVSTSSEAQALFVQAERLFLADVPLETKIAAYEKAVVYYHPQALERILQLYQSSNEVTLSTKNKASQNGNKNQPVNSTKDYREKIVDTYKRMLDNQLPVGYAYLAQLKKEGKLLYKDDKKAYDYMVFGSKQGNPRAQAMLGDYYFYQQGEYERGVKAHQCAAMQGNKQSYHALAVATMVFEENPPKSLKLHVTAANNGSLKSLVFLRSVFRDGLYGYQKDPELMMCFQHFINAYSATPQDIREVDEACPLPDHPDLGEGNKPLDTAKRKEIEVVERKFNPDKQRTIEEKENDDSEKQRKKALLLRLKNNQSRF